MPVSAVKRIGWFVLILLLVVLVALMTWEPFAASPGSPPPPRAYAATITRDEFGVPHIHGKTDADVTFGVGYAHAEDDFSTLQDVVAMTSYYGVEVRYDVVRKDHGRKNPHCSAIRAGT